MKECPICGKTKDQSEFHVDRRRKDGLKRECRQCKADADAARYCPTVRRTSYMQTRYGLSFTDYQTMLDGQGGRCAICGTDSPGRVKYQKFCIDHCHTTGKARGLLCHLCNTALGGFKDNPATLLSAINYLTKYNEPTTH